MYYHRKDALVEGFSLMILDGGKVYTQPGKGDNVLLSVETQAAGVITDFFFANYE